jgi:hypothetical protein
MATSVKDKVEVVVMVVFMVAVVVVAGTWFTRDHNGPEVDSVYYLLLGN